MPATAMEEDHTEEDDTHKKRKLEIEQWRETELAALPPLPDKLGSDATEEQKETRRQQMAERVRQQNKISRHVANARRTLGDDRSAAQVAAQKAANDARLKGDDRSAAQVAAQKAADDARLKGDDRLAAQVAAQKVADAARKAKVVTVEIFCELCNNRHNYKSLQALKQHMNSASHKKRLDPELVAADEVAKKAKQDIYREKETARLAARDQSKAHKAALQRLRSKALYEKEKAARVEKNNKDPVPWIIGDGTEKDVEDALVRYHGSTASAMLLHKKNEQIKKNIATFIRVSPEAKAKIRDSWQKGQMATNAPLFSCGTCGIRDHGNYAELEVSKLPDFFKFDLKHQAIFDKLKGESLYISHIAFFLFLFLLIQFIF